LFVRFFYFYFYVAALTINLSLKSWRKKEGLCFGRWVTFFFSRMSQMGRCDKAATQRTGHAPSINTKVDPLLPTDT
jgi:hypothetical protein